MRDYFHIIHEHLACYIPTLRAEGKHASITISKIPLGVFMVLILFETYKGVCLAIVLASYQYLRCAHGSVTYQDS